MAATGDWALIAAFLFFVGVLLDFAYGFTPFAGDVFAHGLDILYGFTAFVAGVIATACVLSLCSVASLSLFASFLARISSAAFLFASARIRQSYGLFSALDMALLCDLVLLVLVLLR